MKKSQVVATLAAASVMGVVAPLASTASALEFNYDATGAADGTGTATCFELKQAYNTLTSTPAYAWYIEYLKVDAKGYTDVADATTLDTKATTALSSTGGSADPIDVESILTISKNINKAFADLDSLREDPNDASTVINTDTIKYVDEALKILDGYSLYEAFADLMDTQNSVAGAKTLDEAVQGLLNALPGATSKYAAALPYGSAQNPTNYGTATAAEAKIDAVYGTGTWSWFADIYNEAKTLPASLAQAKEGKSEYTRLIQTGGGFITNANQRAFEAITDWSQNAVSSLEVIVTPATATVKYPKNWNTFNSGLYTNDSINNPAYTASNAICTEGSAPSINFNTLWTLAGGYKNVSGSTKSQEEVATDLVGGKTTNNQGNNNQGGSTGDGSDGTQGGDSNQGGSTAQPGNSSAGAAINTDSESSNSGDTNKNGTPNTGVMISEGTNATSASALSTLIATIALAGAGLTIFRRNKKNA